ncbi:MAG: hypothetical protein JEZ11_05455 [Desulfobacterales bacterium]|nr:hypothetical protein [Desulfobacterales bacterium]
MASAAENSNAREDSPTPAPAGCADTAESAETSRKFKALTRTHWTAGFSCAILVLLGMTMLS